MGPINTDGLARLMALGLAAAIFLGGIVAGFGLASVINLGKLCL